ncbi:phage portal protein [Helcococcus bovis]|uniref:phage portal protein n=1 Tax=Helcococcus bovis TaxID=3153252 RepID=UPI0038BCEA48
MSILDKIKKGGKYITMLFEKDNLDESIIIELINKHRDSDKIKYMVKGDNYYLGKNDILESTNDDKKIKIPHSLFKNLVDEKVSYSFSNTPSLTCENEQIRETITDILGFDLGYDLESLAYEASKKGIAWVRPYISVNGEFKLFIAKSEQIIPGWKDATHTDLDYLIRVYDSEVFRFGKFKTVTNVEVWFADEVRYYRLDGRQLIKINTDEGHFFKDGAPENWGVVPWVAFKNNKVEASDLTFVKKLIDSYDLSRSEVANFVDEVRNLIFVLKGYNGESLEEFLRDLKKYRGIKIDDDENAGVSTLNPTMDIAAIKQHYEQIKRDIFDVGQGVNKDLDKFGSAPSGVALKFLFSGLDLKNNQIESEFKRGFNQLIYFVYKYLETKNVSLQKEKIEIVFARDIPLNETETIQNCNNSRGIISEETIIANHPWVRDVSSEIEKLKKEKEESGELFNTAPKLEGDSDEE